MDRSIRISFVLIALFSWLSIAAGEADVSELQVAKGTRAKIIETAQPIYPTNMRIKEIEGWVEVGFVVAKDGTTRDIQILNSSRKLSFDEAATEAVSKWKFEPATLDGKPVEAWRYRRLYFAMEGKNQTVSHKFKAGLKQANAFIAEGDMDNARKQIDRLKEQNGNLLSESIWLDVIEGEYWKSIGDKKRALQHINRALVIADDFVKPSIYHMLLRTSILLNVELGKLASALHRYETLVEVDSQLTEDDPVHLIEQKIRKFLEGEQSFMTAGKIEQQCLTCEEKAPTYFQTLLRNKFFFTDVDGTITELKLYCANSFLKFPYQRDFTWELNREWGECRLEVLGEEGTSFNVVEQ